MPASKAAPVAQAPGSACPNRHARLWPYCALPRSLAIPAV